MQESVRDFTALLQRVRGGDEGALAELARTYEPEVRIVARVLLGPALRPYLDSLDVVQSVHKSLLLGLRGNRYDVSTPQRLVALALAVVRHKIAHHWRRLQRQKRLSRAHAPGRDLVERIISLTRPEADPARAAQYRDAVEHLCRRLDAVDRRLIELRLEGCSTREAAGAMNLDADYLRVRLCRLRRRLSDCGLLSECL